MVPRRAWKLGGACAGSSPTRWAQHRAHGAAYEDFGATCEFTQLPNPLEVATYPGLVFVDPRSRQLEVDRLKHDPKFPCGPG